MGRAPKLPARSRVPLHRRLLADPTALRYWLGVAVAALVVGGAVAQALSSADHARARWGETRPVLVTTRALATGEDLDGAVRLERWPAALVPDGALSKVVADGWARGPLTAGSPVTDAAVGRRGHGDLRGRRTVAVPLDASPSGLRRGDRVDLWASADPSVAAEGQPITQRVAVAAVVASVGDATLALAVQPDEVADVTDALALATVAVVGR